MHLCSRKKAVYSPAPEGIANVEPTAPAGPVYEEVSPKEEIELNNNQAYGPVGLWNLQDYTQPPASIDFVYKNLITIAVHVCMDQ